MATEAEKIEDGGPAFPSKTISHFQHVYPNGPHALGHAEPVFVDAVGMSLRKWFAGQALIGLAEIHHGVGVDPIGTARAAYQFADAMIKVGNGEL